VTFHTANSTTLPGAETVLNGRAISFSSVTMVNTIINVPGNTSSLHIPSDGGIYKIKPNN
jgi:hypothetical protein